MRRGQDGVYYKPKKVRVKDVYDVGYYEVHGNRSCHSLSQKVAKTVLIEKEVFLVETLQPAM